VNIDIFHETASSLSQVLNFFFNIHSLRISIINVSILAFCQVLLNEYDDDDDDVSPLNPHQSLCPQTRLDVDPQTFVIGSNRFTCSVHAGIRAITTPLQSSAVCGIHTDRHKDAFVTAKTGLMLTSCENCKMFLT